MADRMHLAQRARWLFLSIFAFVALTATPHAGAAVTIVGDGAPRATIVVPETRQAALYEQAARERIDEHFERIAERRDAKWIDTFKRRAIQGLQREVASNGDEEQLAADELVEFVEKISGATLPVVSADDAGEVDGPRILLGPAYARAAGLGERIDALHEDGFIIAVKDDDVYISGQRARGTLYGVYELLERFGCRWVMPGEFGEIYPSTPTLVVDLDVTENPDHGERYWWCTFGHGEHYPRWTLRNKGNFVRALGDPRVAQGHAWGSVFNWAKRQEKWAIEGEDGKPALPDEVYARRNGEPFHHAPNFSGDKAAELFADFYIEHFDSNPLAEYASFSASDGIIVDEHVESQRLRADEFDWAAGATSATDMIWFFANRVIDRVSEVHPDSKFGILVYANNMTPPRIEQIHPRMALVYAPLTISPLHHVRDPKSKTNRVYREWLETWMEHAELVGAEQYLYDYEPLGFQWNQLMFNPRWAIIGENYPYFHEMGLDGHTTQGFDTWLASSVNNYVMMRLYWDADLDYKDILREYAQFRFGPAADAMLAYYQVYEDRMAEIPDLTSNENWGNHLVMTPEVRAAAREKLAEAVRVVEASGSERDQAHVRNMVQVQRSTDLMCDAIETARAEGDFGKAMDLMKQAMDVATKLNEEVYTHFVLPEWLDISRRRAPYMVGGMYTHYRAIQERIDAADHSLLLPRVWRGRLDSDNLAGVRGLAEPDADVSGLDELDVTVISDVYYGTHREPAAFFYRTEVEVPAAFKGSDRIELYFPAVIARAMQIWVNGEPVMFDTDHGPDRTWRGPTYFWYNYDHQNAYDITDHVQPGEKNTIAFRVFKSFDHGGPYHRVFLLGHAREE